MSDDPDVRALTPRHVAPGDNLPPELAQLVVPGVLLYPPKSVTVHIRLDETGYTMILNNDTGHALPGITNVRLEVNRVTGKWWVEADWKMPVVFPPSVDEATREWYKGSHANGTIKWSPDQVTITVGTGR